LTIIAARCPPRKAAPIWQDVIVAAAEIIDPTPGKVAERIRELTGGQGCSAGEKRLEECQEPSG